MSSPSLRPLLASVLSGWQQQQSRLFLSTASAFPWRDFSPVDLHHQEVNPREATTEQNHRPIVICHGMLGNSGNWLGLARMMAEETGRTVLLPDARNHGKSRHSKEHTYQHLAADLRKFLSDHDLGEVTLLGHSMGARAAMLLCLTDPSRVRDGISVDATPVHPTPRHGVDILREYLRALKKVDITTGLDPSSLSRARKEVEARIKDVEPTLPSATRQWMVLNLDKNGEGLKWKVNLEALEKSLEEHMTLVPERERWEKFQGEFMFIGGGNSGYIPRDSHGLIRKSGFPNARFAYVADAGHFVHIDQREEFLRLVLPELRDPPMKNMLREEDEEDAFNRRN